MTTKSKMTCAKTPAPSRTRVKELTLARLEALAEKQRLMQPRSRRLPTVSAAEKARQGALAETHARYEQRQKKEPLAKQIKSLAQAVCRASFQSRRRSLHAACLSAFAAQMAGGYVEELPRVRETGPAIRSLDRAEALLTRLVWRGAEWQARQEMKEADARQ